MANFDYKKFLAEGKLTENMFDFDVDTTEKIAQAIADAFTAGDELDLKYTVHPGTEESSFDLDVEAGPNTPGEDWKDVNGFGIDNYLGDFAGGSFYIKDGVVYNAAMRNAPVANVTPEGEVKMISAADSRAAIGMEENKKEIKSNKMKKSELKEMIKTAMLAEYEKNVNYTDENPESEEDFLAEEYGKEFKDALRKRAKEEDLDAATDRIDKEPDVYPGEKTLDPDYVKEADEEDVDVDVDVAADEEGGDAETDVDVNVDAEEAPEGEETIDVKTTVEVDPNVKAAQDSLTQAMEAARALGDQKLADQIGNTITFFTRQHVANVEKEVAEVKINEVEFPMWTRIKTK